MSLTRERDRRYRATHRPQIRAINSAWKQKNPQWVRDYHLRYHYGITLERYNAMLEEQGGGCAICRSKEPGRGRKNFHVDHDHGTGQVRGLLCDKCNRGLGFFNDSNALIEQALKYMEAACERSKSSS